jgi:hypothetical protein
MVRVKVVVVALVAVTGGLAWPTSSAAQATTASGLAGVVRDASGAVLPGVTVEAASPALIEKVKVAVTDSEGRYNIIDLRTGTYSVTFSLPGFSLFVRDGIVLIAGFTAQVNAEMRVGAVEETITVTGESPLIDTQTARSQVVVSSDLLNALPSSVRNLNNLVALTPGYRGNEGFDVTGGYTGQVGATYHGKGGAKVTFDGMSIQHSYGNQGYNQNQEVVQETVLSTSGITAESNADGVQINLVPKEGGNIFAGSAFGLYSGSSLQSNNLSDELRGFGLLSATSVNYVFDAGASLGGPIMKDKMWFYGSYRQWGNERGAAGKYYNATQGTFFYTPDLSRPAFGHEQMESKAIRWTWLMTPRNKLNVFADHQRDCHCPANTGSGSVNAPEAFFSYQLTPAGLYQATWTAPVTSRFLLEAGTGVVHGSWPQYMQPEVRPGDISMLELTTGVRFNSTQFNRFEQHVPRFSQRASMSYVTGSHAFKAGLQLEEGLVNLGVEVTNNVDYSVRNGIPESLTQWATPYYDRARVRDYGFFVQDQWTVKRLTVNYGVRYETFYGWVPAITQPASGDYSGIEGLRTIGGTANGWVPARRFEEVKGIPDWKDINPRVGGAFDLFGNGRTAIKASLGRFVSKTGVEITQANNPVATAINMVSRNWSDANGNRVPDCNLANGLANGECGAWNNQNFGGNRPSTQYADDVLQGWGNRGSNWDFNTEIEHQIRNGVSLSAGYYRNWFGGFTTNDNTLVGPSDFDSYCITAPMDSRLPRGGGYQVCGLADIKPAKFGQVNTVVTQASNFGKQTRMNEFVSASISTRLGDGITLGGGVDTGRTVSNHCFDVDTPGAVATGPNGLVPVQGGGGILSTPTPHTATTIDGQRTCRVVTPMKGNTQIKGFGSYPLPGDFVVSAIFQNIAGPEITAAYAVPTAAIAPSLGRNLAACGTRSPCTSTATVPLVQPGTMFADRMTRLDIRLGKRVRFSDRISMQGNLNVFNVFNSAAVLVLNTTYGGNWQQPSRTMDGRMIQFSGTITY